MRNLLIAWLSLALIASALVQTALAQSSPVVTWNGQTTGTAQPLRGVSFVGNTNGWAVGGDCSGAGCTSVILNTQDGGAHWTPQSQSLAGQLNAVKFVDALHGWAVGANCSPACTGFVVATADGGQSWTTQLQNVVFPLRGVAFVDTLNGWAVGAQCTGGCFNASVIVHTRDGGLTWDSQRVNGGGLAAIAAADATHAWAAGGSGAVQATTDGQTWAARYTATGADLQGIAVADAQHVWAVGTRGTIIGSTDGGQIWADQLQSYQNFQSDLWAVSFANATTGWAVGVNGILGTTDGGQIWTPQGMSPPTSDVIQGVVAADGRHAWSVARSGAILAFTPHLLIAATNSQLQARVDSPFSQTFEASYATPPSTWAVTSGTVAPGLTLDASAGLLSGTPSASGISPFSVQVTDATGATASAPFVLTTCPATTCLFIANISPTSAAPGATVTINGLGFGLPDSDSGLPSVTVTFGSLPANVLSQTDSQILAVVPSGGSGAVDIQVMAHGSELTPISPADQFTYPGQQLVLRPPSLDFGSVTVGSTSASQPITMTNMTGAAVSVSATVNGSNATDFAVAAQACSTAPVADGATCTMTVTLTPSGAGARATTLTVTDNAAGTPHTVTAALSGTGVHPAPRVGLSATAIDFGSLIVGRTTTPTTLTLTNTGNAPLSISSINMAGPRPRDFRPSADQCSGQTIGIGLTCTVAVSMMPTAACAVESAALRISDNALDSPQEVQLTGQATAPPSSGVGSAVSFCLPHLDQFGSNLTGLAAGPDGNVWVSKRIDDSGPGAFYSLASDGHVAESTTGISSGYSPFAITLGPDGNLWASTFFNGINAQAFIDRVGTDGSTLQYPVPLDGTMPTVNGLAAGPGMALWFASGAFTIDTVCATPVLGVPVVSLSTSGTITPHLPPRGFPGRDLNSSCIAPANFAAGPDGHVWFTSSRQNGAVGDAIGVGKVANDGTFLSFVTLPGGADPWGIAAGPDGAMWVTERGCHGIDRVALDGTATRVVAAGGCSIDTPPHIVAGPDGNLWATGDFADGNQTPGISRISPTGTVTFFPTELPDGNGLAIGPDDNVWFTALHNVVRVDIGAGPARAFAFPADVGFDPIPVGTQSAARTITLRSTGTNPVNVSGVRLTGPNAAVFTVVADGCTGVRLQPGQACTAGVVYAPTADTSARATFEFDDDAAFAPHKIAVGADAARPRASLNPAGLTYASTTTGATSPTQTVTLTNSGAAPLYLSAPSFGGANPGDFAVVSTARPCSFDGGALAVGGSCAIGVTFNPSAGGTRTATLLIADNAADTPQTINLSGVGRSPTTLRPHSVVFAGQAPNSTSLSQTVQLTNSGTAAITGVSVSIVGPNLADFTVASQTCGSTLAAGTTCAINVTFHPSTTGPRAAILQVRTGGATLSTALAGSGVATGTGITCVCATTGGFVDAAIQPVTASTTSPHGIFHLAAARDASSGEYTFTVTRAAGGSTVLRASAPATAVFPYGATLGWGFSPDDNSFVFHYVVQDPSNGVPTDTINLYDLTKQPAAVWTSVLADANSALGFSPDGSAFLAAQLHPRAQELLVTIVDSRTHATLFSDDVHFTAPPATPADQSDDDGDKNADQQEHQAQTLLSDAMDAAGWGFAPDNRSFLFVYVDQNSDRQLVLANLRNASRFSAKLTGVAASYRFSPCGDLLGVVTQEAFNSTLLGVDLYSTASPTSPPVSTNVPFGAFTLKTVPPATLGAATSVQITIRGTTTTSDIALGTSPAGAGCPPRTTSGSVAGGASASTVTSPAFAMARLASVSMAAPAAAPPSTGDDVRLVLPNARGTLELPDDLTDAPATITYTEVDTSTHPWPQLGLAGLLFTVSAVDSGGNPVSQFSVPATVVLAFNDADLTAAGVTDPAQLGLYTWDGSRWLAVLPCAGCGVDATNQLLTALIGQPGEYGLFAPAPAEAVAPVTATALAATVGVLFSGIVATVADVDPRASAADFAAVVDWGDSTLTTGVVGAASGGFSISAQHTYARGGQFSVTVTVVDPGEWVTSAVATATVAGVVPGSLALDGSSGYAEISSASELNITGDWTVEAWFKDEDPNGFNHDFRQILMKGDRNATAEAPYFILVGGNALLAGVRTGGTDYPIQMNLAAAGVDPKAWHHVAVTFRADLNVLNLWLDGKHISYVSVPAHSTTGNNLPLELGRNGATTGKYWLGKLDDVRIWNVARTGVDITASYRGQLTSVPAGLIANWQFDDGGGPTASDSAGTHHDATLSRGARFVTDVHP